MEIVGSVPRVGVISPTAFRDDFVSSNKPVVIAGAVDSWRARSKWTREYLEHVVGPRRVKVQESATHIHPDLFSGAHPQSEEMNFCEYLSLIHSDEPCRVRKYLSACTVINPEKDDAPAFACLASDVDVPAYLDREKLSSCSLWLSADGLVTSLHYDYSHNLNVQVRGKKRVLLFSPSEYIYPFLSTELSEFPTSFSQINIEQPDFGAFPRFRSARCVETVLAEGDMLFIPIFWSHAFYHQGRININVNFWWQAEQYAMSKTSLHFWFQQLFIDGLYMEACPDNQNILSARQKLTSETLRLLQNMERAIAELDAI